MKRKYVLKRLTVFIARDGTVCNRCHHHRENEPYVKRVYSYVKGENWTEIVCWRCCHDGDSTELIQQKWPLAFDRVKDGQWYNLRWNKAIQMLFGVDDEAKESD
jgi:hypothetical protein